VAKSREEEQLEAAEGFLEEASLPGDTEGLDNQVAVLDPPNVPPNYQPQRTLNPVTWVRNLAAVAGPTGLFAVAVLAGVSAVERYDDNAFAVLGPEIEKAFGLSHGGYLFIATLTSVLPLLLSVHLGYFGDKANRIRLSRWGALIWGFTAIATGLSPIVVVLVTARIFGGVGQLVNEPVHASLLSDYYPPQALPPIYAGYRIGSNALGLAAGPLAGIIGQIFGWRTAFVVLAIPTFVFVALMVRLQEPPRGATVGALVKEEDHRPTIGEGFRRVRSIRSLRRTWVAAFVFGGGTVPLNNYLNLFFHDVYGLKAADRGFITAILGVVGLVGLALGGRITRHYMGNGKLEALPLVTGLMAVEFGLGACLLASVHVLVFAIVATGILSIGALGFLPSYQTMVALVAPPKVRAQAFGWSLLWYALGALVVSAIEGSVADAYGQSTALFLLGVLVAASGLVECTCRLFVARDIAQATKAEQAAKSDALLVCASVDVAYDQVQVLFGVDLEVHEGEIIALLGTNGAGKSTLLKAISGIVDPIGGAIYCHGRDITHADANQTARLGIVQVPGGRGVFPTLSVAENLRVAGWMYRKDSGHIKEATERVLEYFPVLKERWDTAAGSLSGGEQQMLSLGQAFIAQPRLLLIDELSLGLAPTIVEKLLEIVRAIHKNGTTVILVEQSVNTALRLAERAVFMEKGEVRFSGPTADLLGRTDILRAVFLKGAAAAQNGDSNGTAANGKTNKRPAKKSDKLPKAELERRAALLQQPAALSTEALTKRFGGIAAVSDVDITVHDGEILGLIGPNGAGKTSLFDLICGFQKNDAGKVFLRGTDVTEWPPHKRALAGLGRSFQDARLFTSLTVKEAITVGSERHLEMGAAVPAMFRLPVVDESEREVGERTEELIELLGLGAFRDKFVSELSTGSRRMVEIASILAHRPSVLILDEPSSGIAQKETEALGPLLKAVQHHLGCSMLVIEHDMPLITGLADRLVALDRGRVVTDGLPADVLKHPHVVESYLGSTETTITVAGKTL
jgi:ABC-type branched-subunit amino acid transport system ATPase component/predicted MFS family arabinose efflux permease